MFIGFSSINFKKKIYISIFGKCLILRTPTSWPTSMLFVSPFPLSIGISSFNFFSTKFALVNEITPFALMRTLIFNSCGSPVGVGLMFLTYQRPTCDSLRQSKKKKQTMLINREIGKNVQVHSFVVSKTINSEAIKGKGSNQFEFEFKKTYQ